MGNDWSQWTIIINQKSAEESKVNNKIKIQFKLTF